MIVAKMLDTIASCERQGVVLSGGKLGLLLD